MSDLATTTSSLTAPVTSVEIDEKLLRTIMPPKATSADAAAFARLCRKLDLDPFLREVYALPSRRGGMDYIVGIDGWCKIVTGNPRFRGVEFDEEFDADGKLVSLVCTMHVEGWLKPVVVRERLAECFRPTDPWRQMPARMLRHAALKQCGRIAFGLSGITDPEEHAAAEQAAQAFDTLRLGASTLNAAIAKQGTGDETSEPEDAAGAPQTTDGPAEPAGGTDAPAPAGTPESPTPEELAERVAARARENGVRRRDLTVPAGVLRVARSRAEQGDGDVVAELNAMLARLDSSNGALIGATQ